MQDVNIKLCLDITRTFPINGKFSDTQLAVYEIVLEAERKAIECVQGNDVCYRKQNLKRL